MSGLHLGQAVARRELTVLLRSRGMGVMTVAYLLVLGGLVWGLWPASALYSLSAQASRSIVLLLVIVQTMLVVFYAPAFTAPSIVSEKENHSLTSLLATPMQPFEILLGKLTAVLGVLLMFVVWSFPFFACCFLLGAVSLRETCLLYAVSTLTAVVTGLIGMGVSARAESSHAALIRTYLWMMVFVVGPWLPGLMIGPNSAVGLWAHAARNLSPLAASTSVLLPGFDGLLLQRIGWAGSTMYLAAAACAVPALGCLLILTFARRLQRRERRQRVVESSEEIQQRRYRFPFYLIDPQRRRRPLPGWMNPVFIRELRARAQSGGVWFFRGVFLSLAVSMLLMVLVLGQLGGQGEVKISSIAMAFQLGLIVLLTPALSAGAISHERESGNLDHLRLSRLGPGRLILGKLLMCAVCALFLAVGSAPIWLVLVVMELTGPAKIALCAGVVAATMLLCMAVGLACSAFCRRSSVAVAAAYGLVFAVGVLTLLPWLLPDRFGESMSTLLTLINPFIVSLRLLLTDPLTPANPVWRPHLLVSLSVSGICLLLVWVRVWLLFRPEARQ